MFSLRDGRSIRTVSALLFQLVQTSAHDVRVAARKISKARESRQALRRQDSERSAEFAMDELDAEVSISANCIS
jgi:cohesin loading factor subunit SCC2